MRGRGCGTQWWLGLLVPGAAWAADVTGRWAGNALDRAGEEVRMDSSMARSWRLR